MKKLIVIMIVSFLIFGLTLYAKTNEKTDVRDLTGLAPRQLTNFSDIQQETAPYVSRDPNYQVYAFNAYDPTSVIPVGPVTYVLDDPAGLTSLAPTTATDFMAGACWVADEETWYASQYGDGLYSIDHETGAMTFIASTGVSLAGIEYDDASGIMYGTDGTSLYTVDWTTGATSLIGSHNVGFTMIGMAGDGEGNMYGVTVDFTAVSDLYQIDLATGNATSLGSTGGQLLYAQDLAFDKDDGVLYSAAYFGDGTPPGLYTIDTSTAAMTQIGDFPNGIEVSGFAIPYTLAEDDAPAAVSDLVVTPDAGGALLCDLDWVNPDLTFAGDPLTELLEIRVYRDGVLVYTNSGPTIGAVDGYTDALPDAGMYSYSVTAYNSVGEGPSVSAEVWVGEDIPNAVTDVVLTDVTVGVLTAQLDWINPTAGYHNGYFTGVLGYDIERSDGATFMVTGSATSWQDATIVDPGVYSYTITPFNSVGSGPSTTSPQVGIGVAIVQVGNGEVGDYQIPMNLYYMDSMVEVVYLQEWLGTGMIINTVSFHAATTSPMTNACNLEIWMGVTPEDDLTAGWIDGNNMEQVFAGTIDIAPGDYWFDIPLDDDFVYEYNDNLVMMIIRDDDEYYSTSDLWWCTESGTPNRTRYDYTDNSTAWEFNALTGPWDGTLTKTVYPDVRFYYTPLADPMAPDAATDVTFVADAGGALQTQIDWICPILDYGGSTLQDLDEMRVYRNGALIYTDTSPTIGAAGSYLDTSVPSSEIYEYSICGFNDYGEGIYVYGELWVGEDIPNAVEDLTLVEQAGNGYITWDNPTTGFHGGPFNETILGYSIVRNDGASFDITGIATEYTDTTIPGADYYCYTVTPYNSIGEGPSVTSNLVMLGAGSVIFSDDFEAGLGNWIVEQNGQPGLWMIYTHGSFPNTYTLPATSTGNIAGADADEIYPVDAELILASPLDLSSYVTANIQFDNDWQAIGASDFAYLDVSTDGGSNWTNVLMFDEIDVRETHEIVDITAVAAGQSNVLIRFYSVQPGWDWWWVIDNVGVFGTEDTSSDPTEIVPIFTELKGNYPNPFNPSTKINFSLRNDSRVSLQIYNIKGQLVKTLVDEDLPANHYQFTWNGNDNTNKTVSSGIYFYKMKTDDYSACKKMMLLK